LAPDDPPDLDPVLTPDYGYAWSVAYDASVNTVVAGSYHSGQYQYDVGSFPVDDGYGSARVFVRTSNSTLDWTQQAILIADDGAGNDYSGYTVDVSGDTAFVGAIGPSGVARYFVFVRDGSGSWSQQAMLGSEGDPYADDGRVPRVKVEGDVAVVERGFGRKGKVFVYERTGGTNWALEHT